MKKILVAGSLAYDHLFTFGSSFQEEMIPGAKGPISVSFNVSDKARHFGGCAGNIAYNAKLLGEDVYMMGMAGHDFGLYEDWFKKNGIDTAHVVRDDGEFTSEANVMTDTKGQQITIFHGGAASRAKKHEAALTRILDSTAKDTSMVILSPNHIDFMLAVLEGARRHSLPYFFDPGQAMPQFSKNQLLDITNRASGVFVNEYELSMMEKYLSLTFREMLQLCPLLVVTRGAKGSTIYFGEQELHIPTRPGARAVDPTGCGDAYRAGFLSEIKSHFPKLTPEILERAGNVGTKLAVACLEVVGTQNHTI